MDFQMKTVDVTGELLALVLTDGIRLKVEWRQVFLVLQDSSEYSNRYH